MPYAIGADGQVTEWGRALHNGLLWAVKRGIKSLDLQNLWAVAYADAHCARPKVPIFRSRCWTRYWILYGNHDRRPEIVDRKTLGHDLRVMRRALTKQYGNGRWPMTKSGQVRSFMSESGPLSYGPVTAEMN